DPFGQIADEFVEAYRQGKRPSVEEFARRYPEHADEIREMLPALALMEKAKSGDDSPGQRRPATAAAAAVPLQQLGDYRILREVGRGARLFPPRGRGRHLARFKTMNIIPLPWPENSLGRVPPFALGRHSLRVSPSSSYMPLILKVSPGSFSSTTPPSGVL